MNPPATTKDPLAAFRARVAADPALQARLGAIERPDAYVEAAATLASDFGIALPPDALAAALRPDPLGLGRWAEPPVASDHWPPRGWLPARSVPGPDGPSFGGPSFDWAWFGADDPVEPFFEDSVRAVWSRPFNLMFRTRTTLAALVEDAPEAIRPDGLIFHMSRCGSTLAAQMLAAVPHHHVLSEPEPVDAIVQWAAASGAAPAEQVRALRAIVAALARKPSGAARRVFVKLDAWHALALPLFRAAFPDVPWLFLHRDPRAVMASQMRMPGRHAAAGALPDSVLAIAARDASGPEDYCARALARICAAALDQARPGGGLVVDYADLGEAMTSLIPAFFGFTPDPAEQAAMAAAASRDSKTPTQPFAAATDPNTALSPAAEAAAAAHLTPLRHRFDALRPATERGTG